ncbi:hypothetical protein H5410_057730 [Solanum commersonii]|uniref:Uncharacterized protein n=1 Tax=Solanum commersonii TaxID=4109 RepID=A0A9J5WR11_SOLCO|nr:hypothetical protein H5410_057730 [Solanum commersonii]
MNVPHIDKCSRVITLFDKKWRKIIETNNSFEWVEDTISTIYPWSTRKKKQMKRYLEFEAKHGHYLARRNKAAEKNEEMKA